MSEIVSHSVQMLESVIISLHFVFLPILIAVCLVWVFLSVVCWCGDMLFWLRSLVISVMQFGDNSGLHLIIFDEFDAVCKSRYMYNVRNIW